MLKNWTFLAHKDKRKQKCRCVRQQQLLNHQWRDTIICAQENSANPNSNATTHNYSASAVQNRTDFSLTAIGAPVIRDFQNFQDLSIHAFSCNFTVSISKELRCRFCFCSWICICIRNCKDLSFLNSDETCADGERFELQGDHNCHSCSGSVSAGASESHAQTTSTACAVRAIWRRERHVHNAPDEGFSWNVCETRLTHHTRAAQGAFPKTSSSLCDALVTVFSMCLCSTRQARSSRTASIIIL